MSDENGNVVKVHLVSSDVQRRVPAPPDRTATVFSVAATAAPALLLPHAPRRIRTTLTVCGTAGDTALLCAKGDTQAVTPVGATIQPGQVIPITSTNELWLIAKSGVSIVVGVIAEYEERK